VDLQEENDMTNITKLQPITEDTPNALWFRGRVGDDAKVKLAFRCRPGTPGAGFIMESWGNSTVQGFMDFRDPAKDFTLTAFEYGDGDTINLPGNDHHGYAQAGHIDCYGNGLERIQFEAEHGVRRPRTGEGFLSDDDLRVLVLRQGNSVVYADGTQLPPGHYMLVTLSDGDDEVVGISYAVSVDELPELQTFSFLGYIATKRVLGVPLLTETRVVTRLATDDKPEQTKDAPAGHWAWRQPKKEQQAAPEISLMAIYEPEDPAAFAAVKALMEGAGL